jgi:adenosylcobinamide kinase / adenosylcobinamide-phosphate guanylyltransferase
MRGTRATTLRAVRVSAALLRRVRPGRGTARRTLVLGGARSGKSAVAERRFAGVRGVTYVATGGSRPDDPDWAGRVAAHRARRPPGWRTVETVDLEPLLRDPPGPLLVDCLTLWLTAVMDETGAWDDDRWTGGARDQVAARVAGLAGAWSSAAGPVVAVSSEVGLGVVPATAAGRRFRDELGRLNAAVADASDEVLLVVAGQVLRIR